MVFNKIYFPVDAIAKHENFEGWYEDGALFMTVTSDWESEKSHVKILAKTGAELAKIKPDHAGIDYNVGVERFTYTLKTRLITKHYYFEGMLWDMFGSPSNGHCNFVHIDTGKKDVLVTTVPKFRDKGPCIEVKVRDLTKLRVAACAVVSVMLKEEWKGLSTGEPVDKAPFLKKLRYSFADKGLTYEEVMAGKTNIYE